MDLVQLPHADIISFLREICRGISPGVGSFGAVRLDEQKLLGIDEEDRPIVRLEDGLGWDDETIIIIDWIDPSKRHWHDKLPQDLHIRCRGILLDECGSIISLENVQKIGWKGDLEDPVSDMRSIRIRKLSDQDIFRIIVERNLAEDFLQSFLFVISQQLSRIRNQERSILEGQFYLRNACIRANVRLVR